MDFLDEPPQLKKLIEILLDYNMTYIHERLEIGVDVLWHHGDIGSQKGLVFAPEIFRKYLKPVYKQMFQTCRKEMTHVWYSSDGNLLEIVEKVASPEGGLMIFATPSQDVGLENIEAILAAWEEHCFYNWR